MTNKKRAVEGMLYPEILDKQEYQVSTASQRPSINRDKKTASTIGDDLCDCEKLTGEQVRLVLKPYETLINKTLKLVDNERKSIGTYRIPVSKSKINHARNLRKHVMYKEMFALPRYQGVGKIQKEYLDRAYNLHRYYRAYWNIANKEHRASHDADVQERRAKGQWTWKYSSRGNASHQTKATELFCSDIVVSQVHAWLQFEDTPVSQIGQLLSLGVHGDTENFLEYINVLVETLRHAQNEDEEEDTTDEYINRHFDIKIKTLEKPLTSRWIGSDANMLYAILHHNDVKWAIGMKQDLTHCIYVLRYLQDGITKLTYAEILRRLYNLREIVRVIIRYQQNTLPYNRIVPSGLMRYSTHVKKLGALYQSLCEGTFDEYGKLMPKTLENQTGTEFVPTHYKADSMSKQIENAVADLSTKDVEIQKSAGKHRWANAVFLKGNLVKDLAGALRVRRNRPSDVGAVPKYINRWATDKHVFARKRKSVKGGTVAIDCSGSMHFNADDIEEIISLLPASTIVGYAGVGEGAAKRDNIPEGVIETFAENQRTISDYRKTYIYEKGYGENFVDVPAILWLARQPKPRMLVSDMQVVAYGKGNGYVYNDELEQYCEDLCRKHDIVILQDIEEAKEFAKTIRKK